MCPDSVSVSDSVVASEADGKPVRGREIPPGGGDDAPSRSPWRPPEDRRSVGVRGRERVDEFIKIIRDLPTEPARATAAREAAMELTRPLGDAAHSVLVECLTHLFLRAGEAGEARRITVDDAAGRGAAFAGMVARIAEETIRQIREIDPSEDKERFERHVVRDHHGGGALFERGVISRVSAPDGVADSRSAG